MEVSFKGYRTLNSSHIICLQCANTCKIKDGKSGFCKIIFNENQTLKNINQDKVSALNIDPIEKKPLYHFLPSSKSLSIGTSGCNFRCPFCQNYEISQYPKSSHKEISKESLLHITQNHGCKSISFTYNEPTIFYNYAKEYGVFLKEYGIKSVFVSNGYFSEESMNDAIEWLDAINIDLKSNDEGYYKKILKGDLTTIKKNLKIAAKSGVWLEITTLMIPSITLKDIEEMSKFIANELGDRIPWHISRFYPNFKMDASLPTDPKILKDAIDIANKHGIKYVYDGNMGYNLPTCCPKCSNIAIERQNFKSNILFKDGGIFQ